MIDDLLKFLCIRLKNQLGISKLSDDSSTVKSHSRITFIGYSVAILLLFSYFVYLPFQMSAEGESEYVNSYVIGLMFWILAIWTNLSGVKNLFYSRDHDYIFSLPLEKWQAKISIIVYQYLLYSVLSIVLFLGAQISLIIIEQAAINTTLYILLLSLCIPALAIITSVLLTFTVETLLRFFKVNSSLNASLLSFLLLILPLIMSYLKLGISKPRLGIVISTVFSFPILGSLSIIHHLIIVGMIIFTLVLTSLFLLGVVCNYEKIVVMIREQSDNLSSSYHLSVASTFSSLLRREIQVYTSSFSYVSNTILMPFLLVVVGIISMTYGEKLIPEVVLYNLTIPVDQVYYIIFTSCLILTTTTTSAFSIEGRKIWIMKSLPISILEISFIKLILNLLLFLPGLIIASISCLKMNLNLIQFSQAISLLISNLIFVTCLGLFINFKFPNFKWNNEMEVVKQGASTIITAFISMTLIGVTSILVIFTNFSYLFILSIVEVLLVVYFIKTLKNEKYIKSN